MYLGHVSFALGAKRLRPELPLVILATLTVLLDCVDVGLGLLGREHAFGAWSHTLPAALGWSLFVALLGAWTWNARTGGLLAALTFSHLLADYVTSRLDVWPGGPPLGLHLYRFRTGDFLLEGGLILYFWWLYRNTPTVGTRRRWPAWVMLGLLLLLQGLFDFTTQIGA